MKITCLKCHFTEFCPEEKGNFLKKNIYLLGYCCMDTTITNGAIGTLQVPIQTSGAKMDAVEQVRCASVSAAEEFYQIVKNRLTDVNAWSAMAGLPLSSFKLFDHTGRAVHRQAIKGDFIRIDIPGPGTKTGQGYDWVRVEELIEEIDANDRVISMRVRQTAHPLGEDDAIAHFLNSCATSTFQVKLLGNSVFAEEHGRNERSNLDTTHVLDNIRNAIIGAATKIGFSYPQWKSLVSGLLAT